jgi:enoyl-CoA hydratase
MAAMSEVLFETLDHIAVITLNRPEVRNAVNGEVACALEAAIDRLEADDALWVGVLTGKGPVFCAGADLKVVQQRDAGSLMTERGGFAGFTQRERTKPVIAAIEGPALAGGTEIMLACDLVVAARSARFGIPEVKRSLIAGAGGLLRLPRALPRNVAMELALTGDPIDADRASQLGLVNLLVDEGKAREGAVGLAARIAANAPVAVRQSRRVIIASQEQNDQEIWELTRDAQSITVKTEDFREGPRAFLEKRAPQWVGR